MYKATNLESTRSSWRTPFAIAIVILNKNNRFATFNANERNLVEENKMLTIRNGTLQSISS